MDFALKKILQIVAVVFASFHLVFDAKAAIQYTDFGGTPITLNVSTLTVEVPVPNGLGTVRFTYGVEGVGTGLGRVRFLQGATTRNTSILTSGGTIATIPDDSEIGAASTTWSSSSTSQLLFNYDEGVEPGDPFFDSQYLDSSDSGLIGLRFVVSGSFYYGWVRISNIAPDASSYTIQALAFNDTPNSPIAAGQTADPPPPPPPPAAIPEPASVGLILLGAAGLTMLRRRDD